MAGFNSNLEIDPFTFNGVRNAKSKPYEFDVDLNKGSQPSVESKNSPQLTGNDFNEAIRSANSDATTSRMRMPISDIASSGFRAFKTSKAQASPINEFDAVGYKSLADAELYKAKNNSAAELQANINRVKQYEPLANNEANRAYGMKLATELPYQTFQKSADLFGGARTLASVMPSFDTLRYQKGVSMSL